MHKKAPQYSEATPKSLTFGGRLIIPGHLWLVKVSNIVFLEASVFNRLRDRVLEKPTNSAENLQF